MNDNNEAQATCEECGNDTATEGQAYCLDCMEAGIAADVPNAPTTPKAPTWGPDRECVDTSTLTVAEIDKATAREMMIANHYSHKWNTPFGVHNYGVFRDGRLLGAASFGHPMNPSSWPSIANVDPSAALELNRLWVDDELGKNTETWLLARSWRLLRDAGIVLVQSFSDGRLGVGTIYQAANFTYHGFHESTFYRRTDTGEVMHGSLFNNTANVSRLINGNVLHARGLIEAFVVRTYRYLYPLNKTARKAIILPSQPYPKDRVGARVLDDYTPPVAQVARAFLLADGTLRSREAADLFAYLEALTDGNADRAIELARGNERVKELTERYDDALF